MKRIIDGKKYDTETAKEIGFWANEYNKFDFNFVKETLYLKRTGEFFLLGEGGANSKYARQCGSNSWDSGSEIIPLTFSSAKDWSEENLDIETLEKYFGEVPEDDGKRIVSFSISISAHEKLKRLASQKNLRFSEFLENVIEDL